MHAPRYLSPLLTAALSLATLAGCARGPDISADGLALKRVVVYRNGVGYFEREGRVDGDKVEFMVKDDHVGDFLASLAIMEEGGSSVRSASFPIRLQGDNESEEPPAPDDPEEYHPLFQKRNPPKKPAPAPKREHEKVILEFGDKNPELTIGYIAATPVWRPSYRLVIDNEGASLQAWGIVQNLSGEDWKDVQLSLVAGAPIAFQSTLGTPVIPERPIVTDRGEVIAAVPRSQTSLAYGEEADADFDDEEEEGIVGMGSIGMSGYGAGAPRRELAPSPPRAPSAGRPAAVMPAPRPAGPSEPRNLSELAAIAVDGGTTRYDLPTPISVPNQSATMVMLVAKRVPGEAVFLFAPDGGVPDSSAHPFRVARFKNDTGGLLERGPIAVFEQGAFLGQGMVDPLPNAATATVPFALERSLAISHKRSFEEAGARLANIEAGVLTIERDNVTKTTYMIKNGGGEAAKLLVRHVRQAQTTLHDPPEGTEDNVGSALVPTKVSAHAEAELIVDERRASRRNIDWLSPLADEAVQGFFESKDADAGVVSKLKEAWVIREALEKATTRRKALGDEQRALEQSTSETRRNLKAIEKNPSAGDLRQELTRRLSEGSRRLDGITKEMIEVEMSINEQGVRFQDVIRGIRL